MRWGAIFDIPQKTELLRELENEAADPGFWTKTERATEVLKRKADFTSQLEKIKKLSHLSGELGISMAALSIAWCIKNPDVTTAILGASKKEQLLDNTDSFLAINYPAAIFYKNLKIISIPRYIIYNKSGKLLDKDAPRPSDKSLIIEIDKFLAE